MRTDLGLMKRSLPGNKLGGTLAHSCLGFGDVSGVLTRSPIILPTATEIFSLPTTGRVTAYQPPGILSSLIILTLDSYLETKLTSGLGSSIFLCDYFI